LPFLCLLNVIAGLMLNPCRNWLASDGDLTADLSFADRVHIRFFGNGGLWFRPYGDSLFYKRLKKEAKNARGMTHPHR